MPVLVSVEPGAAVEEHEVALVDTSSSPTGALHLENWSSQGSQVFHKWKWPDTLNRNPLQLFSLIGPSSRQKGAGDTFQKIFDIL